VQYQNKEVFLAVIDCVSLRIVSLSKAVSPNFLSEGHIRYYTTVQGPDVRGDPRHFFWLLHLLLFLKSDSSSCSCSGAHWKFTLQLLFTLRKLENRVYVATWGKINAWTILPLASMNKYCHAFSAGKEVVVSCLCWSTAGFP